MSLSMIEQEAQQFEEKLGAIDQQISEMQSVRSCISEIESNSGKSILAGLGKGIFIKAELSKDSGLFVNVGKGTIIRKTPKETIKIIEEQIEKLMQGKEDVMSEIMSLQQRMQEIIESAQREQNQEEKPAAKSEGKSRRNR